MTEFHAVERCGAVDKFGENVFRMLVTISGERNERLHLRESFDPEPHGTPMRLTPGFSP
jgi:hypothetical protein